MQLSFDAIRRYGGVIVGDEGQNVMFTEYSASLIAVLCLREVYSRRSDEIR